MLIKLKFNNDNFSWEYLPIKNDRETLRLSECATPAIFKEIKSREYALLWPLAARHLYKNERKKNVFHHPEYANRSWFEWLVKFDLKNCKKAQGRNVLLGRFLSLFRFWKFLDYKIINYIKEINTYKF